MRDNAVNRGAGKMTAAQAERVSSIARMPLDLASRYMGSH
jgi:hypothetical protein